MAFVEDTKPVGTFVVDRDRPGGNVIPISTSFGIQADENGVLSTVLLSSTVFEPFRILSDDGRFIVLSHDANGVLITDVTADLLTTIIPLLGSATKTWEVHVTALDVLETVEV